MASPGNSIVVLALATEAGLVVSEETCLDPSMHHRLDLKGKS